MKNCLLDVNVLISLLDVNHVHHTRSMRWFLLRGIQGWVSCPITENGVIRIMSRPAYSETARFSQRDVANMLESLVRNSQHQFVPENFSILDKDLIALDKITSYRDVTDSYLLALAVHHGALFATIDAHASVDAVAGGEDALLFIP